jgi:peroxiredoxin (alkyl hydroperoxide reductase subunit C)
MEDRRHTSEEVDSCVQPAAGPIGTETARQEEESAVVKEGKLMATARVGKQAPDFEASAYISGEGFKNIRLSDYQGQWVVLCFYPGDFTFV